MKDWQSQSHVKWDCKYHVVIVPKYRRREFYGRRRKEIGFLLRDLCRQKEIVLEEGHAMPDHIHLLLSIPPKYAVAWTVGYLVDPDERVSYVYDRPGCVFYVG